MQHKSSVRDARGMSKLSKVRLKAQIAQRGLSVYNLHVVPLQPLEERQLHGTNQSASA